MPPLFKVLLFALAATFFSYANAQDNCASYLEQTVQPLKASGFWKQLAGVPNVKGEYETTAEFEARVSRAMGGNVGPVIVEIPVQRQFIKYDADARRLEVQSYAFANGTTKYDGVFGYDTPFYGKIQYGFDNIDAVYPAEETQTGNYTGTNAMGVKVNVTKVKRSTKVIFERAAQSSENLFPHLAQHNAPVLSFSDMTPEMAKHAKTTARTAIVYIPKAPYYAQGKYPWGRPTIQGPLDIDETIEVAIGDIQCALFLNAAGKVFASIPTR